MRKRLGFAVVLAALIVTAIAAPMGGAATKKPKNHPINATLVARGLEGNVVTGTIKGSLGRGAVIYVVTTSETDPSIQEVAFQGFFAKGTVKGKGTVKVTPQPDGTATVTGSSKITGGTGRYAGAKGQFGNEGTIDGNGIIRQTLAGSVKY